MIKCPSCGHENVDGTQFCEMCGEELAGASAPSPVVSADNAAAPSGPSGDANGMMKCPACDNLNPADNVVCEVCGTELRPGALSGAASGGTPSSAAPTGAPATTPFDTTDLDAASTTPATDAATATDTDASLPTVAISSADPLANDPLADDPLAPAADTPAAPVVSLDADPTALPSADPVAPVAAGTPAASAGSLEPGKVKLVVEQGMTVGKQFVLGDTEVLVGREDDEEGIYPDIDLSDQDEGYVHRKHATLTFAGGGLSVTHLGGANKTRVNNKPLADNTPQPVSIGDKVAFGKVVMRVQSN